MDELREVTEFLYTEAALLEQGLWEDWVALFAPDGLYWVPSNSFEADPKTQINIAYDDVARLRERVSRMKSGAFWAQDPPSRTTRMVSNIRLTGTLVVESRLMLVELRRGQSQLFSGRALHELCRIDSRLRIRKKSVFLIQNNEPLRNLTFLV